MSSQAEQAPGRAPSAGGARRAALGLLRSLNVHGVVTMAALLGLWQLIVDTGLVTAQYIVAPSEIAVAMADRVSSGDLQENTVHTLTAVLVGWGIAVVAGVLIGSLFGLVAEARAWGGAAVDLLRSLPAIALVPPAVLVLGFSLQMEIAVIVWASLWPVLINTAGGVQGVPRELHEVARTFRMSRARTAATVLVPAATPSIIVGARLGMSVAVILAVIAEMVGNPNGLGYAMVFAQQALDPEGMYAYIVTIGLLGVALNGILVAASNLLPPVASARAERERQR